tara:strand:+ start:13804 stop:14070 length:267 start_codon:yes stop_codon:yes gene_type:complete
MECVLCNKKDIRIPTQICEDNHIACKDCAIRYYITTQNMVGSRWNYKSPCIVKDCKKKLFESIIEQKEEISLHRKIILEKKCNILLQG